MGISSDVPATENGMTWSISGNGQNRLPRHQDRQMRDPIAIVGFSTKLPQGVESEDSFWRFLVEKRCASTEFPSQRLSASARYHPDGGRRDTIPFRGGHFIEGDVAAFDAPFFRVSATEAAALDPQQRGMLETTYRALENAGMPLEKVSGSKTSVHTGCFLDDYQQIAFKDSEQCASNFGLSMGRCMLANRISWFFNFTGTSYQVDTACSSTLTALHLACNELINRDADMGVVAGSNLIFSPDPNLVLSNMNMLSPDSRCFSFDSRANGYARGEGFGTLILKRLSDAIRDRDMIRAVIRSTGSNSDGYTPGITQPSSDLQKRLIEETYRKAGLDLRPTRYLEAHATGTPTGDPIEMAAIGSAFRSIRTTGDPLFVGAVKSNFGHSEGLSGIVAVIKAILILEKAVIPPNTNFEELNPKIDAEMLRVKFPLNAEPWPVEGLRRTSVNSFGYGGTNAHVVLDDAFHYLQDHHLDGNHLTVRDPPSVGRIHSPKELQINALPLKANGCSVKPKLLTLSAHDRDGIRRLISSYEKHLSRQILGDEMSEPYLSDFAHTLNARRTLLPWRSHVTIDSIHDLQVLSSKISDPRESKKHLALCFVFTGQGAQWAGMGRELLVYPVFAQSLEQSEKYLRGLGCQWSLLEELIQSKHLSNVNKPNFSQPITTAIQIALTDLLSSFEVFPTAVVGHSSGEIAAAFATGAISARAAMRIAYFRGYFAALLATSKHRRGSMLAVGLGESQAQKYFEGVKQQFGFCDLTIACVNSPKNVTISGDAAQIDQLKRTLESDDVFARQLLVDVAYHAPHMETIAKEYGQSLCSLDEGVACTLRPTMISTVTGQPVTSKELRLPGYWVRNMVSPVKFAAVVVRLCTQSARTMRKKLDCSHRSHLRINVLLEVGPHSALQGPIRDVLSDSTTSANIEYASTLLRYQNSVQSMLSCAGTLHCMGCPIDVEKVNFSPDDASKPRLLTNLPEYPFDHSRRYWHESRISKNFRTDDRSKLDLLGKPVADWNHLEPQWRNFIRVSEIPWVEDHVINGSLIYPAAGMLAMAIEAANQVATSSRAVTGFSLKQVSFERALTIPQDSEGIETRLYLRRNLNTTTDGPDWYEFRLYSCGGDQFNEHCRGLIRSEPEDNQSRTGEIGEVDEHLKEGCEIEAQIAQTCTEPFEKAQLYDTLNSSGFGFGPAFQTLSNGSFGANQARADVRIFHWPADEHPQPHIVHPTTLDGVLHLGLASLSEGGRKIIPTGVPSYIEHFWIAKSGLSEVQNSSISTSTWISSKDSRGFEVDASVLDTTKTHILARLNGLKLTVVAEPTFVSSVQEAEQRVCHEIEFWPDIDLMNNESLAAYCEEARLKSSDPTQFYSDLLYVSLIFLQRALEFENGEQSDQLQLHLYRYIEWANLQLQRYRDGKLPHAHSEWESLANDKERFEKLCDAIEATNAVGRAFIQTGRNLPKILRGEIDPLDFLFRSDLLKDLYHELSTDRTCFSEFERYLNALAQKHPKMRILEIGAGTGGTTANILHTLSDPDAGSRYSCYEYTDLSPSFFEKAQDMFCQYPRLSFRQLDIESDPKAQGFETDSYDLIVAANVLHATKDIELTMRNVRKLLKPGGKLMMYELTRPEILRTGFVAGLMSGWWFGKEDFRKWGPALDLKRWDSCLHNTGFSGLDLQLPDFVSEECQESSIIVSTAVSTSSAQSSDSRLVIVADLDSDSQIEDASVLKMVLQQNFKNCAVRSIYKAAESLKLEKTTFVFIEELERPFLMDLSEKGYSQLQALISACRGAVWVNAGGDRSIKDPAYAVVDGLFRAIRNEYPQKGLATVAIAKYGLLTESQSQAIRSIICNFERDENISDRESEYIEIEGTIKIPRVQKSLSLTEDLHRTSLPQQSAVQAIKDSPPLKLIIGSLGAIDSSKFVEKIFEQPLALDEVEVQVQAIGINDDDSLRAFSKSSGMAIGQECAGVVTRVGRKCDFVPGDRVVMYTQEGTQTVGRWKLEQICKLPETLSLTEAASIPIQFGAAWEFLNGIARVRRGDSVLVTSAAGAWGQAVVQVARYLGAHVFATVTSDTEKQLLRKEYAISEDRVFYSLNMTFTRAIKSLTAGRGIDVVINNLTGDGLVALWECVANYGRFIDVSTRDESSSIQLPLSSKRKNVSFTAFSFSSWLEDQPNRAVKSLNEIMSLVAQGHLRAVQPIHSHDISKIGEVLRSIYEGKAQGKDVLDISPESRVPTLLETKPKYSLHSDATYVIGGGLGGIGRSIARWMVSRGAKHLLLLSRSGAKSRASQTFIAELEDQDVHVKAPPCDIADFTALETVFKQCAIDMPPIRGCIQAAMVLADSLFETMSHSAWTTATRPKIAGSWNLHRLLPRTQSQSQYRYSSSSTLDFFILLSSIDGIIGLPGQANYAAGNTFLDALARHRVANGQKAVSLDLGVMLDDGFLAENEEVRDRVLGYGALEPVSREMMYAMLDYYCDPKMPVLEPQQAQVLVGLATSAPEAGGGGGGGFNSLLRHPLFRHVQQHPSASPPNPTSSSSSSQNSSLSTHDLRQAFLTSPTLPDATRLIAHTLLSKLSRTLPALQSTPAESVDLLLHQDLTSFGIDSLLAVEIRGWFKNVWNADVAVFEILGGATLWGLGGIVAGGRSRLISGGKWEDKEGD